MQSGRELSSFTFTEIRQEITKLHKEILISVKLCVFTFYISDIAFFKIYQWCFKKKYEIATAHIKPNINHSNLETLLSLIISILSKSVISLKF